MRAELKDLEWLVEEAAKNVKGDGNVARTYITLKNAVPIKKGFKGRFSWGRSKIAVEASDDVNIVGFDFSTAILDGVLSFKDSEGEIFKHDYVPLTALPSEILKKLAEESGGWKERSS